VSTTESTGSHRIELERGERFAFGKNWRRFLAVVDEARIEAACASLTRFLGVADLCGRSFLDAGSGSGLFSLAAARLGARVRSFDYDPESVGCTRDLRRLHAPEGADWSVEEGSVLDEAWLAGLGTFDVVYSWGVLHHTGARWRALANVAVRVAPGGRLFVAIYNDQGRRSRFWRLVKRIYCKSAPGRWLTIGVFFPYFALRGLLNDLLRLRNPLARYTDRKVRGMSVVHDWIDWLGGYPFEVARPEELLRFYRARGFELVELQTVGGGLGCNQLVFARR
jgi:2-polyprenyl-6-hydroxyphenyl methylase/3-demethylubiquinone-9 3-methyltransferase